MKRSIETSGQTDQVNEDNTSGEYFCGSHLSRNKCIFVIVLYVNICQSDPREIEITGSTLADLKYVVKNRFPGNFLGVEVNDIELTGNGKVLDSKMPIGELLNNRGIGTQSNPILVNQPGNTACMHCDLLV